MGCTFGTSAIAKLEPAFWKMDGCLATSQPKEKDSVAGSGADNAGTKSNPFPAKMSISLSAFKASASLCLFAGIVFFVSKSVKSVGLTTVSPTINCQPVFYYAYWLQLSEDFCLRIY
jgi:hypothetical protein